MAVADITWEQIAEVTSLTGKRRFAVKYDLPNFNSALVFCPTPRILFASFMDGLTIIITNIEITLFSAGGGTVVNPDFYPGVLKTIQLQNYTTTVAYETHEFPNLELFWTPNNLSNGGNVLCVNLSGYAATDDIYITVRGYVESTQTTGEVQPVTLEGYKWPLTKRRA